jgi:hypothetical protein
MCEIDTVEQIITKIYIIINASRLGWDVVVNNNKIVLTKRNERLTKLDKNTPKLIKKLIQNAW